MFLSLKILSFRLAFIILILLIREHIAAQTAVFQVS